MEIIRLDKFIKKLQLVILFSLFIVLLSGCNNSNTTTLVLDYTPNTNHSGIYIAQELGYYEELGINLEIIQPPESGAPILVAAGKADFGISFQDDLATAYATEPPLPITTICTIVNHNTSGFIYRSTSAINSPKDFHGKKLIVWDTPIITEMVKTIITEDGGDPSKVEIVYNNVADPIQLLTEDETAIVWGFAGWDLTKIQLAGLQVDYMPIKDLNPVFDYYTPVILTNNKLLEENSELVTNFVKATAKGYEYVMANPAESVAMLEKAMPEIDSAVLSASINYLADEYKSDSNNWGEIDPDRWNDFYKWTYEKGLVENQISDDTYTNVFIPRG